MQNWKMLIYPTQPGKNGNILHIIWHSSTATKYKKKPTWKKMCHWVVKIVSWPIWEYHVGRMQWASNKDSCWRTQ